MRTDPHASPARAPKRARIVTDRKDPSATITTSIPRTLFIRVEQRCEKEGIDKAEYVRRLIEDDMESGWEHR
jgi:hypothetical protein